MIRIIGGLARGRLLSAPPGTRTRPTSDRAREGFFASVTAQRGSLEGARVLDLYAGSGAIGLEALSRGAARAVFVESDPRAAQAIRANMTALGLPGGQVIKGQVARVLARGPGAEPPFDLAAADPPYAMEDEEIAAMLVALTSGWLVPGAIVAVERASRSADLAWPPGYSADRSRRYGEATFWYGLAAGT
ncbi:MAG TPA: 16S rRNA (guanine(966)-N(2))-methyltransferase RsmD [Streptosporangiaceae bacterium]